VTVSQRRDGNAVNSGDATPRRVLLVEDNRGDARLVETYLQGEQEFEVIHVSTVDAALREAGMRSFDIVVVDLGLPDSFGLQTFRRIYEAVGVTTPVVILSGTSDEALATAAVASGAQDYLRKDELNATVLIRTVRYAIERHRLQREIDRVDRLASVGRLAATMAHEFNNVLMAISPWATIVTARGRGDQQLATAAAHIHEAIRRGKGITFQVLDYVRPGEPKKAAVELRAFLADAVEELAPSLRLSPALILEDLPPQEIFVLADRDQLAQVVSNLVRNADEASARRTPIRLVLRIRGGEWAEIAVIDEGTGIPAADRGKIFEPLYSTKRTGTGLGLTVAFHIARAHGGAIAAEANEPAGSRFVLTLPLAHAPLAAARQTAAIPEWIQRVLIVDDEPAAAEGVKCLLLDDVPQVEIAGTGAEALAQIPGFNPDLVILDVGLPDMSGVEVLRRMASPKPPLIIFATGHVQRQEIEQYLGKGVAHVTKPYALEDLWHAARSTGEN
jgi:two-component system, cell cycle sensor histidine kinase and response regulator CckA